MIRTAKLMAIALAAAVIGAVVVPSARAQAGFPDVPRNHWAADAIQRLHDEGILKGYPAPSGTAEYSGNRHVTRYELAVVLWRFAQYIERADAQPRQGSAQAASVTGPQAVRGLVDGGYLPEETPLALQGQAPVTADQLSKALSQVLVRVTEKRTPVTPESLHAPETAPDAAPVVAD